MCRPAAVRAQAWHPATCASRRARSAGASRWSMTRAARTRKALCGFIGDGVTAGDAVIDALQLVARRVHAGETPLRRRCFEVKLRRTSTAALRGRSAIQSPQPTSAPRLHLPMPVPVVEFSDERLANGLRLIVAEDHLAPVVAVHVWYHVGSKHEVPGKTGFAHLFEHVMFQGSANVGKSEHMALVQGAGGTLNGTTWLDRTNYFETLPSHQLELALWLEADRMGTLLDALSQENLDNQRDVVKNEKRWSYDNRPYGHWLHKVFGHVFPEDHPYHHPTIGSMEDLDAASLDDVKDFFATWYAPEQRGALGRRRL